MKKKILILTAVGVSGLAAVVASNVNCIEKDAEADGYCEAKGVFGNVKLYCTGPGSCSGRARGHNYYCPFQEVNE